MKPFYAFKPGELFATPDRPERVFLKVPQNQALEVDTGEEFDIEKEPQHRAMIAAYDWSELVPEHLAARGYDDERLKEELYALISRTGEYIPLSGKNYYLETCDDPLRFRVDIDPSSGLFFVQERVGWTWYTLVFCETDAEEARLRYYIDLSNRQNPSHLCMTCLLRLHDHGMGRVYFNRYYFNVKSDAEKVIALLESQNQQR